MLPIQKIMILCSHDEPLYFPDSVILPLKSGNGVLGTELSIMVDSCLYSGTFMLDTGYGSTLLLSSKYSEENSLGKKLKPFSNSTLTDGAGISSNSIMVTVPHTFFAGETFPLIPAEIDGDSSKSAYTKVFDGLIGYDLLKRFNTIWNFKNSTLTITPNFDFYSPFNFVKVED